MVCHRQVVRRRPVSLVVLSQSSATDRCTVRKFVPISLTLVIVVTTVVGMVAWMSARPSWQISARNSPQGVVLDVYKSNAARPTYSTVLAGQRITTEVERVERMKLPNELGKTTFHDETLRPGRWTVRLNETEVDITERALIIDRSTTITPQD